MSPNPLKEISDFLTVELIWNCLRAKLVGHSAESSESFEIDHSSAFISVSDIDLLRELLPRSLYKEIDFRNLMILQALSFLLRHELCQLISLLDLLAARDCSRTKDSLEGLRGMIDPSNLGQFESLKTQLAEDFTNHGRAPLVGFSALGAHIQVRSFASCRAFDAYNIVNCISLADDLYCKEHQDEKWWLGVQDSASGQAHMKVFYHDVKNMEAFDEEELKRMQAKFWERYAQVTASPDRLSESLSCFEFASKADLIQSGYGELKRRYLRKSLISHPDRGGQSSDFIALNENYQLLLHQLRLKA